MSLSSIRKAGAVSSGMRTPTFQHDRGLAEVSHQRWQWRPHGPCTSHPRRDRYKLRRIIPEKNPPSCFFFQIRTFRGCNREEGGVSRRVETDLPFVRNGQPVLSTSTKGRLPLRRQLRSLATCVNFRYKTSKSLCKPPYRFITISSRFRRTFATTVQAAASIEPPKAAFTPRLGWGGFN